MGEAGLRSRYGVSVLAVQAADAGRRRAAIRAGPEDRFERGDVLIVLGTDDAIAASARRVPARQPGCYPDRSGSS